MAVNASDSLTPNLEALLAELMPAARRLAAARRARRRTLRIAAVVAATLALASGAAVAGFDIIGSPAPPAVQRDLAAVDRGMPRDLRLDPRVDEARAVAATGHSVVYYAPLEGGGYCAELVTAGARPRGAVCSSTADTGGDGMSVTVPFTDPVTDDSRVTVSGRVSAPDAAVVELVYPDGGTDSVPVGKRRFYVADVPSAHLRAVHRHGLLLVARREDGAPLGQAAVPTDAITPPSEAERPHDPIELDTVSTESDLTLVLRVRGSIHVAGVGHLELRYPDGTTARIEPHGDRFDYPVPRGRRGDFMTPGTITAYDAHGKVLAERPVAAVAYWHSER
jgi:hypothetical protein